MLVLIMPDSWPSDVVEVEHANASMALPSVNKGSKGSTVEPHLTVTSLVRKPPHYSHPGSVPICILRCK